MTNRSNGWTQGWAFYQTGSGGVPNEDSPELIDWMKGFAAAMTDYDLEGEYPSIQVALMDYGIDADLLAACLDAAEQIVQEPEFNRWPSVPVRGFGGGNLQDGAVVFVLPDAANDETMK